MKNFFTSLMVVAALAVGATANAGTIDRDSDGDLEINLFANIQESFRVSISSADMDDLGGGQLGMVNLNGALAGFDGLKSIAADECRDNADTAVSYAGATSCDVVIGPLSSSSDSHLAFSADFAVDVEISGPGSVSLSASLAGPGVGLSGFTTSSVVFASNSTASVSGMVDTNTDTLQWDGTADLDGGPAYDETIVVTVSLL